MNYRIFIDDQRFPTSPDWMIARTSYDAIYFVSNWGMPNEIAFDHDLGGRDTSIAFIYWMLDYLLDNNIKFPVGFKYSVHSQNPVGAKNIRIMMDNIIDEIGHEKMKIGELDKLFNYIGE